jgi:hypothetical protein
MTELLLVTPSPQAHFGVPGVDFAFEVRFSFTPGTRLLRGDTPLRELRMDLAHFLDVGRYLFGGCERFQDFCPRYLALAMAQRALYDVTSISHWWASRRAFSWEVLLPAHYRTVVVISAVTRVTVAGEYLANMG